MEIEVWLSANTFNRMLFYMLVSNISYLFSSRKGQCLKLHPSVKESPRWSLISPFNISFHISICIPLANMWVITGVLFPLTYNNNNNKVVFNLMCKPSHVQAWILAKVVPMQISPIFYTFRLVCLKNMIIFQYIGCFHWNLFCLDHYAWFMYLIFTTYYI